MVGVLGPRVGGAHVDVNLKFDDKSVSRVGKQIHRQLSKLGNDLAKVGERNREVYRAIGRDAVTAWRALLGAVVAGAPLVGSAISAVAGAATMLAGALYSAVQASYGFAPLLTAIGVAAGTAAIGMNGFIKAVKSGDLSGLTPSAKAAASAIRSLSGAWQRLRDTVQERMFKGLADDIRQLSGTLFPVLEKGLGKMADALNGLAKSVLDYINSAAGLAQIDALLENSADIFDRLSKAVIPFLDGLLKLLNALAPAGKRLADRIAEIARSFQDWASAPGFAERIDNMMRRAEKTAGLLFKVLGNLGGAIANIFNAANPATNVFLQMLVDVTQRFRDWSESVGGEKSIAEWAMNSVDVMRQFGKTLEAVFKVIAELSDPRVITSFLKTVEEAFNYLGKLPLDKLVDGFVRIAEAIQPVSSLFLAIIIAGAGFNVMVGSVIGQLGGLVSVLGRLAGPLAGLFKPLASAGKHGKELSGLAAAFGRIVSVVARFAKFIPFVGWAVWIGTIIAKSKDLQKKLGDLWDSVKDFGKSFVDAFEEIGEALQPLMPAFDGVGKAIKWVFDILDKVGEFAIGLAIENLIIVFKGLADIVRGVGKIIAGVINVIVGLFSGDMDKVTKGLGQLLEGAKKLLDGLFDILLGGVLNAAKAGLDLIGKWWDGFKSKFPAIMSGVGAFLSGVLQFFASLPGKLLILGVRAFLALGAAIIQVAPIVLARVGSLVMGVVTWIAKLPAQLLALGIQALVQLASAVISGTPRLLKAAANIFNGVVAWISRLPGRLLTLGLQTITKLAGAVSAGIGRLKTIAGNIFKGVVSALTGLPGRLFSLGQQVVNRLASAVSNGVSRLKTIAGNIKDAIFNGVKNLPGEMLKIGGEIIGSLVSGLTSQLKKLKNTAGKIGGFIKGVLPGSPVEYGPLRAWNRGSGATGGGRNVIDAIAEGLRDTSPIRKAMADVAAAVASSTGSPVTTSSAGSGVRPLSTPQVTNPAPTSVTVNQNNYGPQTGSARLREIEWTLRYAVNRGGVLTT